MSPTLLTVGHGTADEDELGRRLTGAGVATVVDVRIAPGSRRHPHVAAAALSRWLTLIDISYRSDRRLGGFRKPPAVSPDVALRNASFRGYAAWMRGPDFVAAVDELLAGAERARTTVMCSESLWWRCHRRLIADYVRLSRGWEVRHILPDGRLVAHEPTSGVRVDAAGVLFYDAGTLAG